MPRFTREHLFHIRPVGSLVKETHETCHELKRAVGSASWHSRRRHHRPQRDLRCGGVTNDSTHLSHMTRLITWWS
jgi:hypothetical protein